MYLIENPGTMAVPKRKIIFFALRYLLFSFKVLVQDPIDNLDVRRANVTLDSRARLEKVRHHRPSVPIKKIPNQVGCQSYKNIVSASRGFNRTNTSFRWNKTMKKTCPTDRPLQKADDRVQLNSLQSILDYGVCCYEIIWVILFSNNLNIQNIHLTSWNRLKF